MFVRTDVFDDPTYQLVANNFDDQLAKSGLRRFLRTNSLDEHQEPMSNVVVNARGDRVVGQPSRDDFPITMTMTFKRRFCPIHASFHCRCLK